MRVSTIETLKTSLLPLATLGANCTRLSRRGKALKFYRPETAPAELSTEAVAAITALLELGHSVRVFVHGSAYTLALVDGQLSWDNVKATVKAYRPTMIVKVA
jgi:hypothetical protein